MSFGNVIDKFLNKDSFSDSGSSEETNFSSSGIRGQKIDNFNTGNQEFSSRSLILE